MAKYMSFDFSDGECDHTPIVVRIDKDLTFEELGNIDKEIQNKIDEYCSEGEYWDSDELLISEVIDTVAATMQFTYEIIKIDYYSVG